MSNSEFVIQGGLNVTSGSAKVPYPVNPSDAVNIAYLSAVTAPDSLPPRLIQNTVLTADLATLPTKLKWKSNNIHDKFVDPEKSKYLHLLKVSPQAIPGSLTDISFGTEVQVDRVVFEISYDKTFYIVKEAGTYVFFGQMSGTTSSWSNFSTLEWSVYSDYTLTGTSFSPEPGIEVYTTHGNNTKSDDNAMFGFSWIIPAGGVLFKVVAKKVSGASSLNGVGCNLHLMNIPNTKYIDTWTDTWATLNAATWTGITMTDEYIHDNIYTFTAPSQTFSVTTTGNYYVSVKVSFQRTTAGTDTSAKFRLIDQTGALITGTSTGTQYLQVGTGSTQNLATMSCNILLNLTANVSTIRVQAIIDDGIGLVRAKGGLLMMKIDDATFPNQSNFVALSTATPTLDSNNYIIPWQTNPINIGSYSFTPGNTFVSLPRNGRYLISLTVSTDNPQKKNNKVIYVDFQTSGDDGVTWKAFNNVAINRGSGFTTSIPVVTLLNTYIGTRLRAIVSTSAILGDGITLATGCRLSILSTDHFTSPVDLYGVYGNYYRSVDSNENLVLELNTETTIASVSTKYVTAGIYKVSYTGDIITTEDNTSTIVKITQSSINKKSLQIFNNTLFYQRKGNHSVTFNNNITFEEGITRMVFTLQSDKNSTSSSGRLMIEIYRVI